MMTHVWKLAAIGATSAALMGCPAETPDSPPAAQPAPAADDTVDLGLESPPEAGSGLGTEGPLLPEAGSAVE